MARWKRSPRLWLVPTVAAVGGVSVWLALSSGSGSDHASVPPVPEEPAAAAPLVELPPPVAEVLVLVDATREPVGDELALVVGDTVTLAASAADEAGAPLPEYPVAWRSTDPSVALVDATGSVIGLSAGTAGIVAASEGVAREIAVHVRDRAAETPLAAPEESRSPPASPTRGGPSAAPGTLQLLILPWANVYVDEIPRGEEVQRLELSLPPGRHRLRLENPNTFGMDTTFVIRSGRPTLLRIHMTPGEP